MDRRLSRRCALGALLSLVVYGLACIYPAAWSPDSEKVIFPVFADKGRMVRLMMTDLACEPIREVARVTGDEAVLGSASWSPDGRWVAYVRFSHPPADGENYEDPLGWALHVQDAVTGDDQAIMEVKPGEGGGQDTSPAGFWPPTWVGPDSLALLRADSNELVVIDRQGKTIREVDLPDRELVANTAVLSADGQRLAWVDTLGEDEVALFVKPLAGAEEPETFGMTAADVSDDSVFLRPAWSGDGRLLYFPDARGSADDPEEGLLRRLDVDGRQVTTVWSRERTAVVGVDVSRGSGLIALDCTRRGDDADEATTIEVLDPETGQSTVIHASSGDVSHIGTAISPDGRWVAFCPALEGDSFLGAIVSADGGDIRFFIPEGAPTDAAAEVVRERLETSLELLDVDAQMQAAGLDTSGDLTPYRLSAALEVLDRLAAGTDSALHREALAYARVHVSLAALEDLSPEARVDFVPRARTALEHFEERYPEHPMLPELRDELDAALRKAAESEEGEP
ncbi:MAG: hypothetical protein R6X33_02210 [Candidatus Brocadiia bacterium]